VLWRASGLALPSTIACDTLSVPTASKVSFVYDTLNRLKTTSYGDASPSIARTFTPDGLPLTITSNGAVWTNTYNKRRLNERESLAYGGTTYNLDRAYDANASLLQLKYPDLSTVAYSPNALGEPTQAGTFATAVTYHPNGAIASFTYGNSISHTLQQNTRGLPEWSTDAGVLKDNYVYDENANVKAIYDWQEGISNRDMTYDNLDRLKTVLSANTWGTATYAYDALDNLTSSSLTQGPTLRSATHNYDAATNRLTNIASATAAYNLAYSYDAQGNITQRGTQAFVFDQGNRLTSAPGKGTYTYDGLGHRVSVVGADGVNRVFAYSQGGQLLFLRPTSVAMAAGTKYIYLHNHLIAETSAAGTQYDHTDGIGSPVAWTDSAGGVTGRTRYEPYGATASGTVPSIGFTGHVNAADIGLVYMQQRYYDPIAGSMLSIDPVTTDANTGDSFNRYSYANNSPYKYIDTDGRDPELPSFFTLSTVEGLKRETTLDQAVQRGELTRGVTMPAIAIAVAPSAIGVVGTGAVGVPAVAGEIGGAVVEAVSTRKAGVAALTLVGALGKAVVQGPKPASLPQQGVAAAMRTLKQIAKESKVLKAEKGAPPPPPPPPPPPKIDAS
jgi:RHS repeat-associated protein